MKEIKYSYCHSEQAIDHQGNIFHIKLFWDANI